MPRESPPRPTLRRRARHSSFRAIDSSPAELDPPQEAVERDDAPPTAQPRAEPRTAPALDPGERRQLIERAAYFRSERRGFVAGHEIEDWLEAEREIDASGAGTTP